MHARRGAVLATGLALPLPGRTRHIHAKVQARGGRVLTTQLYFPGEPRNAQDDIFRSDLLVSVAERGIATFDFVAL